MTKCTQMSKQVISSPIGQIQRISGVTSHDMWRQPRFCIKLSASKMEPVVQWTTFAIFSSFWLWHGGGEVCITLVLCLMTRVVCSFWDQNCQIWWFVRWERPSGRLSVSTGALAHLSHFYTSEKGPPPRPDAVATGACDHTAPVTRLSSVPTFTFGACS